LIIASTLVLLGAPREGANAGMVLLIQFAAIFAILYFLLIRPQRQAAKRHQVMLQALKKGDEVMTEGGILGKVVHLKEDRITIRTGENTSIVVARPKIARVFQPTGDS
jgi:preprotein translocase subunit YajC